MLRCFSPEILSGNYNRLYNNDRPLIGALRKRAYQQMSTYFRISS